MVHMKPASFSTEHTGTSQLNLGHHQRHATLDAQVEIESNAVLCRYGNKV